MYVQRGDVDLAGRVHRMARTIAHRGPDDEGIFAANQIALGHRRLSIIDLTSAGAQPMTLSHVTVAYNGEAYNFQELRRELIALGCEFRGHSDTEVLLHAYAVWGVAGLTRLEGMFAFALWDSSASRLVLMRDRLGIKPLFYAWDRDRLAFGSEIKAVLAGIDADRRVDEQALAEYLWYGNSFEDRTIYSAIRSLPPGHRLIVEDGKARIEAWWRIEEWLEEPSPDLRDPRQAADLVRNALDAAVARQLVSDVPVGIFLSGGIDSSSIAASAALASGRRLQSFAAGFDYERGSDELAKARGVAELFGFEHHELRVRTDTLEEVISALVKAHDEPFADAANIPLYLLSQSLGGAVKVVLQGDGGDEMFAGYRRYSILRNLHWWQLVPAQLASLLPSAGQSGARLGRLVAATGQREAALRMALLLTMETLRDPPTAVLQEPARTRLQVNADAFASYRKCAMRFAETDPVQQMLLTDIALQLPSQFLPKVDRATMALGLETRVPLLDEKVARLAVRIPAALKVQGAEKKIVLREAMRGRLPGKILDGPKTGFGVPYAQWLRGSLYGLARAAILDRSFVDRFELARPRLLEMLEGHRQGSGEHGFLLWKLLQLSLWAREYLS
jgi:asparagine synthase (glutamine-hydrolysing)